MDANLEIKGLGISELLDKIMQEEEKKSKKKQNESSHNNASKPFEYNRHTISTEPTISVRSDISNLLSYPNANAEQIAAMSPASSVLSQHMISPSRTIAPAAHSLPQSPTVPVHTNAIMHGMPTNGNISNTFFENYNPHPPIQNIECYGKHCAAVFEPPTSVQSNFPLSQQYPELNDSVPFPAPPKSSPMYFDSSGNYDKPVDKNEGKGKGRFEKKKKKSKHSSPLPRVSYTPALPPPPSPPKLLNFSHNSQRACISPRPFTPPMRPYTPPDPRPFTPPELSFTSSHTRLTPSYTNHYPGTPSLDSYSPHSPTSSKPPEPLEPPPTSPKNRDCGIEDSRSFRREGQKRKWNYSEENQDNNPKSKSSEINQERYTDRKLHPKRNYRGRFNNNFSHSRGRSNYGRHNYKSKTAYNKKNNIRRDHPSTPLGVRFPVHGERHFNLKDERSSMNTFGDCPPFGPVNHNPAFPIVEGMPFPPPGVVFNNMNNTVPSFCIGGGPSFNPSIMGERPPFVGAELAFNPLTEGPLNPVEERPPFNPIAKPPYNLMEEQSFNNTFNEVSADKEYPVHKEWSPDRNPPSDTEHHKSDKKKVKKKLYKDSDQSEYSDGKVKRDSSRTKHIRSSKHKEEKKLKNKKKKRANYELEPGEYISDSDLDGSPSSSEESTSESEESVSSSSSSSSSSSDTEDSLYKLEFLNKRKPKITRYDKLSDKDSDDKSKIVSDKYADKPKYPRYFKDKVAFSDDTSMTFKDNQESIPKNEISHTDDSIKSKEESKMPQSPQISSESLKTLKTPLMKRLGLVENQEKFKKCNEGSDVDNNEIANMEIKKEEDRGYPSYSHSSFISCNENTDNKNMRSGSPLDFEEYRQRSNSLSPNNSLDFEEYKLLASTKEILSASKSIFKSPTSPKATTTKKYEKPIIKVETVSKRSPYITVIKESPQRIDLDSRIKLMFGMKSCGEDNSPEKKNFRNAAFSCKNMRLLSRPPSPFRSKNAYQFWHRETYYFRKNNPIPDVFFDPTQKRKIGVQIAEFLEDTLRFPNVKPDYYQSNESNDVETQDYQKASSYTNEGGNEDIAMNKKENIQSCTSSSEHAEETFILSSSSHKSIADLHKAITKVDIQPDSEIELIFKEPDKLSTKEICDNQQKTMDINKSSIDSDLMIQLILNKFIEELKNDIKEKLTEHLLDEKLQMNDISCNQSETVDDSKSKILEGFSEKMTIVEHSDKGQLASIELQSNVINESNQS